MPTALDEAMVAANLPAVIQWRTATSTRRRTLGITIEPDTTVTITAPEGADPQRVARAVRAKKDTIVRAILKARETTPEHSVKELVSGEGFPLLGRNYRLRVTDDSGPVRIDRVATPNGSVPFLFLGRAQAHDATAIIAWYQLRGEEWLAGHAPDWANRLSATGLRWTVTDLGERPGAFRPASRTVALHWALFALDRNVIEYVLVRQVARFRGGEVRTVAVADEAVRSRIVDWQRRSERLRKDWRETWTGSVSQRPKR